VNRRPRDDAELRSAAGDSRPGRRIASVYGDFRRSQRGPDPVRTQFSDRKVTESVLDLRQHTQMAADSPRSTAVEHSSHAAPAVAGAVLMLVNPGPGKDSSPEVPALVSLSFNRSRLPLLSFPSLPSSRIYCRIEAG
jgi:hypothetical protein